MESILELGIGFILFLQGLGGWLVAPMTLVTTLGNEEFYLFVAPAVFWCWDAALGLRLGLSLMLSGSINSILKLVFHGPRPYWYDPGIKAHVAETSFGVPSGHSQNSVVFWGVLAAWFGRRWAWIVAALIALLIGLSRMVLGVHFPHDVLLGWLVGALILWAILSWEKPILSWLKTFPLTSQILIAFGASLFLILLSFLVRAVLGSWQMPQTWIANAAQSNPDADPLAPLTLSGLVSNAGAFFGLAFGGIWLRKRGWFNASGHAWQLLVRFLIGLAGVFIIWSGLGEIFPRGESMIPYILRYLRYALVGLWMAGLAPMLFIRLGLAKRQTE